MRIEERIEVAVPLRTAYDQWSQFGSMPKFCKRVRLVAVERPSLSRWMVQIGPTRHVFLAEVVEQQPDSTFAGALSGGGCATTARCASTASTPSTHA